MANMIKIKDRNYELIDFSVKLTNQKIAYRAISLAKGYLAIADNRIYNTLTGKPLLRSRFETFEMCLDFALQIEKTYQDYFEIWEACPEADLLLWCRYTVPGGLQLFEIKELIEEFDVIDAEILEWAYEKVEIIHVK